MDGCMVVCTEKYDESKSTIKLGPWDGWVLFNVHFSILFKRCQCQMSVSTFQNCTRFCKLKLISIKCHYANCTCGC